MKRQSLFLIAITISFSVMSQEWTPQLTQQFEPVPKVISPGMGTVPPSDAIVLFDGTSLDNWESDKDGTEAKWNLSDGILTVDPEEASIRTKQAFGDIQLHIEWRSPAEIEGEGQGRGNSGIYFQGLYEIQVLDSYENDTYVNGQAGAVYKQHIPLVNACRAPGEWQTYDIIFTAPRFKEDGSLLLAGRFTVIHNGVLIQNNVEIKGTTEHLGLPLIKPHGKLPLMLQQHKNPVSYRNIWLREL